MLDLIPDGLFLIGPGRHDRVLHTRTRARTHARTHARNTHNTHTHTTHTRTQHNATRTQDPREHMTHTICSRVRSMDYRRSRVNVYCTPTYIDYTPTHIFCTPTHTGIPTSTSDPHPAFAHRSFLVQGGGDKGRVTGMNSRDHGAVQRGSITWKYNVEKMRGMSQVVRLVPQKRY